MGTLSFHLPESLPPAAVDSLSHACLAGSYDLTPVPTRRQFDGPLLSLSKDVHESGYLMVPWPVPGSGCPVTLSATLRERQEPYHLLVELARGKLNQVRNQTFEWEAIGLIVDPTERAALSEAVRLFGHVVVDPVGASGAAADVLGRAIRFGDRVTRLFTEQLLHTRLSEGGKLATGLGVRLPRVPQAERQDAVRGAFNTVRLVPQWRAIEPTESGFEWDDFDDLVEWAVSSGLRVSIGPLVDPTGAGVPDWVKSASGDLPSLTAYACDFVETTVRRYGSRVSSWEVFSGLNHAEMLDLTEDDRLRLAARLLETARQTDPNGAWVVGLAQPWGDYLAENRFLTYTPLVFADSLLRAGFTLAAIELELLCGSGQRASRPRDGLDVFRLLELFGVLGVPLEVSVGAGHQSADPTSDPQPGECPPGWAGATVALCAAMPQIRNVFWQGLPGSDDATAAAAGELRPGDVAHVYRALREQFVT